MATEKLLTGHTPGLFSALHGFVAANTLCIYNLHYFIKSLPKGVSDRADWSVAHKWVHPLLIFAGGMFSAGCMFFLPLRVLAVSFGLGLLSVGYSMPVLPFGHKKRLRDWGILKVFLLALVWTCVTVVMPMLYYNKSFEDYEVEFLLRFVFMLPLCIAFDIRDMETDKGNSIYTVPNAIGLKNTYLLIDICLVLLTGLVWWQYVRYPLAGRMVSGFAIVILTKFMVFFSRKVSTDIFYLLCIDGLMLVYASFILLS